MRQPLIIAHRGASAEAPENTLAAFRRAIELGADGVEFDVRLAADGVPVVIHDATLERTAGLKRRIADLTSDELAKIDVGSWFGLKRRRSGRNATVRERAETRSEQTIPTLERTLRFLENESESHVQSSPPYEGGVAVSTSSIGTDGVVLSASGPKNPSPLIYIELKIDSDSEVAPLTDAVARVVADSPLLPNLIIKSFNLRAITRIRKHLPNIQTAPLFGSRLSHFVGGRRRIVDIALEHGATHLSLHHSLVTRRMAARAAAAGLPIAVWTVNDPHYLHRAGELEVYAVITNDPGRFAASR